MKRRSFLIGSVAAGTCFTLGGGWWLCRRISPEYLLKSLGGAFQQPEDLIFVGNMYLEQHPEEHNRKLLGRILAERFRSQRAFHIEKAIRDLIHEDFDLGQVVELEGWMVSRTEARLCALAALWE